MADREVQVNKYRKQQEDRPKILCEGEPLDNAFNFKYLGTQFNALADQVTDVKQVAYHQSHEKIWAAPLHLGLK